MIYAYIEPTRKPFQYNMLDINYYITSQADFERLKPTFTSEDTLYVEKGTLLANTQAKLVTELMKLTENGLTVTLLDNPFLSTTNVTSLKILEYLNSLKDTTDIKFGRPKRKSKVNFDKLYKMYLNGDTKKAIELSGLSRATFYRRLEQYEKMNNLEKRRNSSALAYGRLLSTK